MANQTQTIRIESILGGHGDFYGLSQSDQFLNSYAVDPLKPAFGDGLTSSLPSGALANIRSLSASGDTINGRPLWMIPSPKTSADVVYVYTTAGSIYSVTNLSSATVTALGDLNDGGSSTGNGAAYYDNYVYFARDTTVARYGPLNGTPAFTDDYWVGTLGKTALENSSQYIYLGPFAAGIDQPNHPMVVHSGSLYFADVIDGQGVIHKIKTTKTTEEGDTDSGSEYDVLDLPFGWYPTALESYGDYLVILAQEDKGGNSVPAKGKVLFWDTISESPNIVVGNSLPDNGVVSAVNLNGVLYVFTHQSGDLGVRVLRYVGGTTFEQIRTISGSLACFQGGAIGYGNRLYFTGSTYVYSTFPTIERRATVWVLDFGLSERGALFSAMGETGGSSSSFIYSLALGDAGGIEFPNLITGLYNGTTNVVNYEALSSQSAGLVDSEFYSKYYVLGSKFKITKISFQFAESIDSSITVEPYIVCDNENTEYSGATSGLPTISSSNYSGKRRIVLRPVNATGEHGFFLRFKWTDTGNASIVLPITIEYELLDD